MGCGRRGGGRAAGTSQEDRRRADYVVVTLVPKGTGPGKEGPRGRGAARDQRPVRSPSICPLRVPPGRPVKLRGTRTAFFGRIFEEADSTPVPGTGRSRRQVRGIRGG